MPENKPGSIIEGVAEYLMACPLLKDGAFRVDALGDDPVEYVVETGVFTPTIETYIDGSKDMRYQVTFGSRENYDLDRIQNIENSAFYERLANWIAERNEAGELPELPEGCHPETIEALDAGHLLSEDGQTAQYQIIIEVTYHKDAPRRART